jgi:hypothetical protein
MAHETTKSRLAVSLSWGGLALAAFFLFLYLQADNNLEPQPDTQTEPSRP